MSHIFSEANSNCESYLHFCRKSHKSKTISFPKNQNPKVNNFRAVNARPTCMNFFILYASFDEKAYLIHTDYNVLDIPSINIKL